MLYHYSYKGMSGGGLCAADKDDLEHSLKSKLQKLGAIGLSNEILISVRMSKEEKEFLVDLQDIELDTDQDEISLVVQLVPAPSEILSNFTSHCMTAFLTFYQALRWQNVTVALSK